MAAAIGGRVVMAARNANIIPDRRCFLNRRWPDSSNWRPQGHLVASFSSTGSSNPQRKLVLYTKPGCCLCDGLKEKLDLALKLGDTDSLQDVELQTRDILSNPEWERRYQYEIPVLARVLPDGTESYIMIEEKMKILQKQWNASKSGVAQETIQNTIRRGSKAMGEQEAGQILGVTEQSTWDEIVKRYDVLFEKNAASGSFYLHSKVHRAKECNLEAIHQKQRQSAG